MSTPSRMSLDEHAEKLDAMHPGGPTDDQVKDYTIMHVSPRDRESFKKHIYSIT